MSVTRLGVRPFGFTRLGILAWLHPPWNFGPFDLTRLGLLAPPASPALDY